MAKKIKKKKSKKMKTREKEIFTTISLDNRPPTKGEQVVVPLSRDRSTTAIKKLIIKK